MNASTRGSHLLVRLEAVHQQTDGVRLKVDVTVQRQNVRVLRLLEDVFIIMYKTTFA